MYSVRKSALLDILGEQVACVDRLVIAFDLGQTVWRVGGRIAVYYYVVGLVCINIVFDARAVGIVVDVIIGIIGVKEASFKIRALY